jgi:selenocysteine lyase/cysteine desulfurase
VDSAGELHISGLAALLGAQTRLVAFTHSSNVVGTIHPVREITDLVHRAGALAVVDGVCSCPHGLPDIAALGADIYLFSLYKVYGPHVGAMYVRKALAEQLPSQAHFFKANALAGRFTPAGPDHPQVAAINGVIDYMEAVASRHGCAALSQPGRAAAVRQLFRDYECERLQPLLDFLAGCGNVRLIGSTTAAARTPTVAFTVAGRSSASIATELAKLGIGAGVGNFYAWRLLQALGIDTADGVVRVSLVHYTSSQDVDRLIAALRPLLQ